MDKRTILALVLMALVIVLTPMLYNPRRAQPVVTDSTTAPAAPATGTPAAPATAPNARADSAPDTARAVREAPIAGAPGARTFAAETAVVAAPNVRWAIQSAGASPVAIRLNAYRDLRPGARDTMTIRQDAGPLLHYRLAVGRDTISLDTVSFTVQRASSAVTFTSTAPPISISYSLPASGYLVAVRGTVSGAPPGSTLLVDLPQHLRSGEADTIDDTRHLAYGFKINQRDVASVGFGSLDPGEVRVDTGAIGWVATRTKYFLMALIAPIQANAPSAGPPFTTMITRGAARAGRVANRATATVVKPLADGVFTFDIYAGPQSWETLRGIGNDLENVNPYAGWFHGVVQPFSTIVMRVLLWLKRTTHVNYGWVLVIFGVVIRLMLWPLNQKAMRTSIQMQRLQPELAEVQKRYKSDPEKQREALVKLYQSHGMSPLSPLMGCVPMLLPMPILFALYFVFQNTIEFRGVPFLWLPDISLKDPFYIIPVVMGVSMFVLSWIGMRAAPPNPQTKMMSYMMPVMFTVMFLNFASGLNLYYAVQNIAALPQQLLLSRERQRAGPPAQAGTKAPTRPNPKA
jgi:YidC/Oxa1 family membrane protein insertase